MRTSREMTQFEMALLLGVSVPSIQRWESGRSRPTKKTLARILAKLEFYDQERSK